MHAGYGPGLTPRTLGEKSGTEEVALSTNEIPSHNHTVNAVSSGGNQASPAGALPAVESTGTSMDYSNASADASMASNMVNVSGGSQPHNNLQPYGCVNFIIALSGIYPSRN